MELRDRAGARLTRALAALAAVLLLAPAAARAQELEIPNSQTEPPRYFERSAADVKRIASRAQRVREERAAGPLDSTAYTRGAGRWQVSFFRNGDEVAQVHVDDRSGAVLEQWSGDQVAWRMARGYSGAFGRKLNAPYVWIPLCLLFLLPFLDFRRPLRLLHLDLLVLLAFGISHVFFNRGEIGVSVPLAYPVLAYLLIRVLLAGLRPRERPGRLVPHVPLGWLAVGLVFLVAFRVALNVVDSNVIDVGYAGVIGADRIVDGDDLYGEGFSEDVESGDTYGPVNYLLYVPFEQLLPWSGAWDDLPAARGAAIAFDLLAIGGLLLLGRALRGGREGKALGVALAYAWAAYPYTAFALNTGANDTLVAVACIAALLGFAARSAAATGIAVALGAASKFAPLALAPLFARRAPLVFGVALVATLGLAVVPFLPDGGLREMYDRTLGYQAGRGSPFSIWGQVASLDWLQTLVKVAAVALALAVALVPRRPDLRQMAALGAAVLIALQLAVTHWFYLYVVWFVPFVLVVVLGAFRERPRSRAARARPRAAGRGGVRREAGRGGVRREAAIALALLAAGWVATLWVAPWSDESVNDLFVYRVFTETWLDGNLPYRDVPFEYPPLAAPAIAIPGLAGTGDELFRAATAGWTLLFAAAVVLLCGVLASRTGGDRRRALLAAALLPLLCGALVRTHFDIVPVALMLGALALLAGGRPRAGMALLGLAAMTKGFPIVAAPVALAWLAVRQGRRTTLHAAAALAAGLAIPAAAALALSVDGSRAAVEFHLERPVQVESLPASALLLLGRLGAEEPREVASHRSDGLEHPLGEVLAIGCLLAMLAAIAVVAMRGARGTRELVLASLAAVAAFAALGKVLSPQYMVWLVPLGALAFAWRMHALAAAVALTALLTQVEFPARYFELVERETFPVVVVAVRNLVLLGVVALALRELGPGRQEQLLDRDSAPARVAVDDDGVEPRVFV